MPSTTRHLFAIVALALCACGLPRPVQAAFPDAARPQTWFASTVQGSSADVWAFGTDDAVVLVRRDDPVFDFNAMEPPPPLLPGGRVTLRAPQALVSLVQPAEYGRVASQDTFASFLGADTMLPGNLADPYDWYARTQLPLLIAARTVAREPMPGTLAETPTVTQSDSPLRLEDEVHVMQSRWHYHQVAARQIDPFLAKAPAPTVWTQRPRRPLRPRALVAVRRPVNPFAVRQVNPFAVRRVNPFAVRRVNPFAVRRPLKRLALRPVNPFAVRRVNPFAVRRPLKQMAVQRPVNPLAVRRPLKRLALRPVNPFAVRRVNPLAVRRPLKRLALRPLSSPALRRINPVATRRINPLAVRPVNPFAVRPVNPFAVRPVNPWLSRRPTPPRRMAATVPPPRKALACNPWLSSPRPAVRSTVFQSARPAPTPYRFVSSVQQSRPSGPVYAYHAPAPPPPSHYVNPFAPKKK